MITARLYCEISINKTKRHRELARDNILDNAVYSLRHNDTNLKNLRYCQPKAELRINPTFCHYKAKPIWKEKQRSCLHISQNTWISGGEQQNKKKKIREKFKMKAYQLHRFGKKFHHSKDKIKSSLKKSFPIAENQSCFWSYSPSTYGKVVSY